MKGSASTSFDGLKLKFYLSMKCFIKFVKITVQCRNQRLWIGNWTNEFYLDVSKVIDGEEKPTPNCIKLLTVCNKVLPNHMLPKEHLYIRVGYIF